MTDRSADPADGIAERAAEWLVRLSADGVCADDHAAFEAWKRADPRHSETVGRMLKLIERTRTLGAATDDTRPLHAALDAGSSRRGRSRLVRAGTMLALAAILAVSGLLALRIYPPAYLLADLRSPIDAPVDRQLPDDSHIALRGGSAVNLHFDGRQRTVELVRGTILVDVAADAARPFVVRTDHGSIQALGTRFAVLRDERGTVLTMLESRVVVKASNGADEGDRRIVDAGQQVRIDANGVGAAQRIDAMDVEAAWAANQLMIWEVPLPEVLDELAKQRVGILRYDRASLADIKVSAVLPLGDTDKALRLLASSLNLRIDAPFPGVVTVARTDSMPRDR